MGDTIEIKSEYSGEGKFLYFHLPEAIRQGSRKLDPWGIANWMDIFDTKPQYARSPEEATNVYGIPDYDGDYHPEYTVLIFYDIWQRGGRDELEYIFPLHPVWNDRRILDAMIGGVAYGSIEKDDAMGFIEDFLQISFENIKVFRSKDFAEKEMKSWYKEEIFRMLKTIENIPEYVYALDLRVDMSLEDVDLLPLMDIGKV